MSHVLPDRDQRHLLQFYWMSQIDYKHRLWWAGSIIAVAMLFQLLWPTEPVASSLIITLPMLLFATVMLMVKGYDLKPRHGARYGQWENTTRQHLREARNLQDRIASWDMAFVDITSPLGVFSLVIIGGLVLLVSAGLASSYTTEQWAPVFALDAAVLLLPHWITGTKRGWRPVSLSQEIDAVETALRVVERQDSPKCEVQPMFKLSGKGDMKTPIGARAFVRFPEGHDDLLGLQFQVSINDVQGTKYPYLYAVIVARKSFGLLDHTFERCRKRLDPPRRKQQGLLSWLGGEDNSRRLTVEQAREDDVDVIIIRQHTTKESGYHTDSSAIVRIATSAWQVASELATTGDLA